MDQMGNVQYTGYYYESSVVHMTLCERGRTDPCFEQLPLKNGCIKRVNKGNIPLFNVQLGPSCHYFLTCIFSSGSHFQSICHGIFVCLKWYTGVMGVWQGALFAQPLGDCKSHTHTHGEREKEREKLYNFSTFSTYYEMKNI